MRARCFVAIAALMPACDLAFGLERDEEAVSVELTRRYLFNDPAFSATRLDEGFSIEQLPNIEVFTEDGQRLDLDIAYPVRTLSFQRPPGARYRLVLHVPEQGQPLEIQTSAASVRVRVVVHHRPDAAPSASFTTLSGLVTPSGPTTLYTTGFGGVYDLGFGAAYTARPAFMLDATRFDRAHFVRYGTVGTVSTITLAGHVDVRMQPGSNDAPVELLPPQTTYCAHVTLDHAAEQARLASAYPDYTLGPSDGWAIYASPSLDDVPSVLYLLASPVLRQLPADAQFAVPFGGFRPVLNMGAQRARKATDVVTLFAGTTSFAEAPLASDCAPATIEAAPVAIAKRAQLDGVPLDRDDVVIARRAVHVLAFEADGPGEMFELNLDDVTSGQRSMRHYAAAEPRFVIDGALLEPGRTYVAQLGVRRGTPDAGTGDFASVVYPHATSYGASSLFTIAAE